MSRITKIEGQLEIDHARGVIYFHAYAMGTTRLRICGLPKPIPKRSLDISHMHGCDWEGWEGFAEKHAEKGGGS